MCATRAACQTSCARHKFADGSSGHPTRSGTLSALSYRQSFVGRGDGGVPCARRTACLMSVCACVRHACVYSLLCLRTPAGWLRLVASPKRSRARALKLTKRTDKSARDRARLNASAFRFAFGSSRVEFRSLAERSYPSTHEPCRPSRATRRRCSARTRAT